MTVARYTVVGTPGQQFCNDTRIANAHVLMVVRRGLRYVNCGANSPGNREFAYSSTGQIIFEEEMGYEPALPGDSSDFQRAEKIYVIIKR